MGVCLSSSFSLCVEHLRKYLLGSCLQSKAHSAGFVRRNSKLTADTFLIMLLYCSSQESSSSLNYMCGVLDELGVDMRKQSLDGRFNASCVDFVKSVLSEILEDQFQQSGLYQGNFWKNFTQVRIKDSTKFKVPDHMSDQFKGNGGSVAGICIQYEYDLVTGKILDLSVGSGGGNDLTNASQTRDDPQAGDLIIRDLGYYSLDVFQTFTRNKAYFLSRLNPITNVYHSTENCQEVDFEKIYNRMLQTAMECVEMEVVLGEKYKLPVRMVLTLVEEQVYQKRIREREAVNRKRGSKMADKTRIRYRFSIYITNASSEQLPKFQLFSAYRLRWQIELIFKCWKSLYKIHQGRKMSLNRYLCMLYIKLILVVLNLQLTRSLERCIHRKNKNGERQFLSIQKVLFTLRRYCYNVLIALFGKSYDLKKTLLFLWEKIAENHWLEKKKSKQKMVQINTLIV